MPSLAKHHLLRAYLPLMVPFRTRFSRHEVVHVAYVQRLMGYLYTSWWSTTFLLYASRHTGLSQPTITVRRGSCGGMLYRLIRTSVGVGGRGLYRDVSIGGLCLAGAPGTLRDLVAVPAAPRVVPRLHHDRMLGT